ncbi:hypothetical protein M885DRAFT_295340 [Pelagophyceae sp. CCMP2097]|nr:hypothetical protein M885DRAFT_295340 [Pelagophyceae sp. CCMP2097]
MLSKSSDFDDSDDDESAPARAEPAPARAEPAPARAEPAPVRAEPAPVRAVPKTTPKSDDDDDDDDDDDSVAAPVAAPGASLRDRMQGFNADAASSDDDDDDDDDEPAVAPKVFGGPAQFTARTATAQAPKLQFSGPKTFDSGSEASPAAKGGGAGPAQFTASTAQAPKLSAPKTFDSGSEASPAKGGAQFAGHFSDSEESAPASPLAEASAPRRATARYNAPRTLDSGESPAASPAPTRRTPAQFNAPPTLDSENESPAAPTRRPFNAPRTLDSDESPAASPAPTKRTSAQFNAPQTLDSESDASPAKRSAEAPLFGGDGATFSRRDGANEAPSPAKPAKAAFNPRQSFSDSDASTPAASPAMSASRPNSKAPEKPSPRRNSESESESSPVLTKRTFGKAQPRASETGGRNNLSDDSGSDATPQKSPRGTAARDDDGVSRSPGWRVTALARGGDGEGPPQTVFGKVARGPRRSSPAATFESPAPRSVTQIDSIASYKSSGSEASPRPSEASPRASEARASSPPRRTFVTGASPASPVTRPGPSRSLSSVESFSDASIPHLDAAPAASNAQRASQPPPTPASVSKEEDDDEGSWDNVEASSDEDSPVKRPPVERPAAVQRPVATPRGDDDDSSVDIPMMGSARSSATKSSRKPPQRTSSLPTEDSPLDDIPDLDAESLLADTSQSDVELYRPRRRLQAKHAALARGPNL